jgi:lipoprotein signal peptidase
MGVAFLVVGAVFLWEWSKSRSLRALFPWLLLVSAGGSNLAERLFFGCVYDYLSLPFFPTFNLSDAILTLSVVFLVWKGSRD